MSTATEIHNKEKTLAELMVKILKEPLNPLEASIKALNGDLADTRDSIAEINDTLGASADDAEKATKSLLLALRKIREEDVPSLLTKLQKHITDQSASDARAVEALLEQSTAVHTSSVSSTEAVLLEAIAGATQQQGSWRSRSKRCVRTSKARPLKCRASCRHRIAQVSLISRQRSLASAFASPSSSKLRRKSSWQGWKHSGVKTKRPRSSRPRWWKRS